MTGRPTALRARRHRDADVAGAGAEDRDHAGKIGGQRIAFAKLDPRRVRGVKSAHIMIAVGRKPADARAGRSQQAQFRARQFAGADEQHRAGLQIEKYRQESHATLASPTFGVDWNYFLYMSRSSGRKEKIISSLLQLQL